MTPGVSWVRCQPRCLLGPMVPPAERRQITEAGGPAQVIRNCVVQIAAHGGSATTGCRARPLPYLDQVLQPPPGPVPRDLVPVIAPAVVEWAGPESGEPSDEGFAGGRPGRRGRSGLAAARTRRVGRARRTC